MPYQDDLLDIEEVARIGRRSKTAIYSERYRGEGIGALGVRVGKKLVWRRSDIETWFDNELRRSHEAADAS